MARRAETPILRRLFAAAAAGLLMLIVAVPTAMAAPETRIVVQLDGEQEVPGPGDLDGFAIAYLSITPEIPSVCYTVYHDGIGPASAMHIHEGIEGVAGPPVVTLPVDDQEPGYISGCATGLDATVLATIRANLEGYYLNIHTEGFPDGAVRGQLEGYPALPLSISVWACPAGIGPADVAAYPGPVESCTPVMRSDFDDLPDGFRWVPEPLIFDWTLDFIDEAGDVLTENDLRPYGDPACDGSTMECGPPRNGGIFFDPFFSDTVVLAGSTEIDLLSIPEGFVFGFARAWGVETIESDWAPLSIVADVPMSTLSFDTSDQREVAIRVFFVPEGSVGPPPSGPGLTPPWTATVASPATTGDADVAPAIAILAGLAAASLLLRPTLRRPRREP